MKFLIPILGVRALGSGRALESYLAFICAVYALIILFWPGAASQSVATADIAQQGWAWGKAMALPFALKALFTGYGTIANRKMWRCSKSSRIVGAVVGSHIWFFFLVKYASFDAVGALGTAVCIGGIIASLRIIGMAAADLPEPGAPGRT